MDWVLLLIGSFLASVAGSYAITRLGMRRKALAPKIGTTLRLRARSGVYRSKLIRVEGDLWRISTPLQRNNYVPLRVSEPVTVEAPVPGGVYLFRTSIAEQDSDRQELSFLVPNLVRPTDRRSEPRWVRADTVSVDDFPGMLVDLSKHGARIKSSCRVRLGDRVKVRLPEGLIVGWVIDAWPTRPGDAFSHVLRVRFEAPIAYFARLFLRWTSRRQCAQPRSNSSPLAGQQLRCISSGGCAEPSSSGASSSHTSSLGAS